MKKELLRLKKRLKILQLMCKRLRIIRETNIIKNINQK